MCLQMVRSSSPCTSHTVGFATESFSGNLSYLLHTALTKIASDGILQIVCGSATHAGRVALFRGAVAQELGARFSGSITTDRVTSLVRQAPQTEIQRGVSEFHVGHLPLEGQIRQPLLPDHWGPGQVQGVQLVLGKPVPGAINMVADQFAARFINRIFGPPRYFAAPSVGFLEKPSASGTAETMLRMPALFCARIAKLQPSDRLRRYAGLMLAHANASPYQDPNFEYINRDVSLIKSWSAGKHYFHVEVSVTENLFVPVTSDARFLDLQRPALHAEPALTKLIHALGREDSQAFVRPLPHLYSHAELTSLLEAVLGS